MLSLTKAQKRIYGGHDPLTIPTYSPTDAARYIHLPVSTVRAWIYGDKHQPFKRVVEPQDNGRLLSFLNLVELHVVRALRRNHEVNLDKIRKARKYLSGKNPLANERYLFTDNVDVIVKRMERYISASEDGQEKIKEVVGQYLKRIDRDIRGVPVRLFPYIIVEKCPTDQPMSIEINPLISFGRPCIAGSGVPTAEIAGRFLSGDGIGSIASDFELDRAQVEEAIRFEQNAKTA